MPGRQHGALPIVVAVTLVLCLGIFVFRMLSGDEPGSTGLGPGRGSSGAGHESPAPERGISMLQVEDIQFGVPDPDKVSRPAESSEPPSGESTVSPLEPDTETVVHRADSDAPADSAVELDAIRFELGQLSSRMDVFIEEQAILREENEQLRRELGRIYAERLDGELRKQSWVPRPGNATLFELLEQARAGAFTPAAEPESGNFAGDKESTGAAGETVGNAPLDEPAAQPSASIPAMAPGTFTVVKEWGRTPEQAEALGTDVPSLCGMIIAVPPGVDDESLASLGREIRAANEAYDNINVTFFDDIEAARAYADRNVDTPEHRVLRVSRFRATGEDVILRMRNGLPEPLSPETAEPQPSPAP